MRVVSNDLNGDGRLLIEDLSGCDIADMCWASASALAISASDGRIAVFLMQQELGQLTFRMICSWRAVSGSHYSSIAFASAATDHNLPSVLYAGTAAGIINSLAMYAPFNVVGLVNAGSCVNHLEFSAATASSCACLFAATAANGIIKVELAQSLMDRASSPVSFNPLQSVPSLPADATVQSIALIGPGHLLASGAHNHVIALIDCATLEVLQCLRINSDESEGASASSSKPNVLFCNANSSEGCGHVFVSRFEATELLCFRINRQQPVPVIDWVSKQDIEYPVMCMQSAPTSGAAPQLRVVLYQTSYVRMFTIDTVSSIVSAPATPAAAVDVHVLPAESNAASGRAALVVSPSQDHASNGAAAAAAAPAAAAAGTDVSLDAASAHPDSVAPNVKAKVVQNSDVFRSAVQISSDDRTESSTAATSNVASVLSQVLSGSTTPGDYTGSSDFSPKVDVQDAFAFLPHPPAAAAAQPSVPLSLDSSASAVACRHCPRWCHQ